MENHSLRVGTESFAIIYSVKSQSIKQFPEKRYMNTFYRNLKDWRVAINLVWKPFIQKMSIFVKPFCQVGDLSFKTQTVKHY